MESSSNTLDLKNPYFRYTGAAVQPPPGLNNTSPSESYWTSLDAQGARQAVNMVNGMSVNGLGEVSMDTSPVVNPANLLALGNFNVAESERLGRTNFYLTLKCQDLLTKLSCLWIYLYS